MGCGCKDKDQNEIKQVPNRDHARPLDERDTPNVGLGLSAKSVEDNIWKSTYEDLAREYEKLLKVLDTLPNNVKDQIDSKFYSEDFVEPENTEKMYKIVHIEGDLRIETSNNNLTPCDISDTLKLTIEQTEGFLVHAYRYGVSGIEDAQKSDMDVYKPQDDELF